MIRIFLFVTILLSAFWCFGQSGQGSTTKIQNQSVSAEHPINFELVDEKGNPMKYIMTWDERKKIEDKIKAYEKQMGYSNRIGKIYLIDNVKYEVVNVKEQEK